MTKDKLTFEELCLIEPRLMNVYTEVRRHADWRKLSDWRLLSMYKNQITPLVGWETSSTDTRLTTSQAYDTVYQTIYKALTDYKQNDTEGGE